MIHMVLVYRRSTQTLLSERLFDDVEAAIEERIALDRRHWGDRDIEVASLHGDSVESIHVTHGRFFESTPSLVRRASKGLRSHRGRKRHQAPALGSV